MRIFATVLTGAAGLAMAGSLIAPASAQTAYPQSYGYQQSYGYPGYEYNQGYTQAYAGNTGVIGSLLEQLLSGNRYNTNDRTAIQQCAAAAQARSTTGYRPSGYGYDQRYNQGYNQGTMRPAQVVAITSVQRKTSGLKISGLMDSGRDYNRGAYGYQGSDYSQGYANGYANPAYAAQSADLKFSCKVDYRGYVSDVRINRNTATYRG